jgi:L-fuculose-phosphate aldolase
MECFPQAVEEGVPEQDAISIFHSPEARQVKEQIVLAGKKLWQRQYVDGNGGNISVRISPHYVICTPTLLSKGDLTPDDLSLIDMNNQRLCGDRPHTSEVLLHLEIYNAVPEAKAVIHCHPPYATAHAVAGVVPQGDLVPEQEVFIGPVALAPYETPGTKAFAETVLPYVKDHNTVLLSNHGIVCWADTVAHAEWYVEIIDTYCKTIMLASQLRSPLPVIPPDKINDLLAIKKKLGLPDARFSSTPGKAVSTPAQTNAPSKGAVPLEMGRDTKGFEELLSSLTASVLDYFAKAAPEKQ